MANELTIDGKAVTPEQMAIVQAAWRQAGGLPAGEAVGPLAEQIDGITGEVEAAKNRAVEAEGTTLATEARVTTLKDQVVAAVAVTPGNLQANIATPTVPPPGIASGGQYWAAITDGIQLYLNTGGVGAPVSPTVAQPNRAVIDATLAAFGSKYGATDPLNAVTGRTLEYGDGTTGSYTSSVQSDGIQLSPAINTKLTVWSTSASPIVTGRPSRIKLSVRSIAFVSSQNIAVGFGPKGSRLFIVFRSGGTMFLSNDAYAVGQILASSAAAGVYAQGNDVSVAMAYDGKGGMTLTFTTPNGTQTKTISGVPDGPLWIGASGNAGNTVRFLGPLSVETLPPLDAEFILGQATDIAEALANGKTAAALAPGLESIRRGRRADPVAPVTAARTWALATATKMPWRATRFGVYLNAAASVSLKRFDAATGAQIGSDVILDGALGLNIFDATKLGRFSGNAGELLGFYTLQGGVTSGNAADDDGWYSVPNSNANAITVGSPTTTNRLEAYFDIEQAYTTPARTRKALLSGARTIALPSEFSWSPVAFGVKADNTIAHDYNPLDYLPLSSPSAAGSLFYVDPANGSDANNGTSAKTAFKTLYKALHNVAGTVWVRLMDDTTLAESAVGATLVASAIVIVPYNRDRATVSTRVFPGLWSLVPGTVKTYEATFATAPTQVWDKSILNSEGFASRLSGGSGTGELQPGTRTIVGNTVRARTIDGRVPDDNIIAMADGIHLAITQGGQKVWHDGINFEGGASHWITNAAPRSYVYGSNGELRYGSKSDDMFHNYATCDSILYNVFGYETSEDLFGYASSGARGIEIDCGGKRNGYSGDVAANVSTLHNGSKVIRAVTSAGKWKYTGSFSRPVHDVQGSASVNLGIPAGASFGTPDPYLNVAFVAGNPGTDATKMYLALCSVEPGSTGAFATNAQGVIYSYRTNKNGIPDHKIEGADPTVQEWWPFA